MKLFSKLSNIVSKKFFLKSESYASFDLPKYFSFDGTKLIEGEKLDNRKIEWKVFRS